MKNLFYFIISIVILVSCGKTKKEKVNRVPFEVSDSNSDDKIKIQWNKKFSNQNACEYLESWNTNNRSGHNMFQLYHSFYVDGHKLFGSHKLSRVVQLQFALSAEMSTDSGPVYRSYDPWSFYSMAKGFYRETLPPLIKAHDHRDALIKEQDEKEAELDSLEKRIDELKEQKKEARKKDDYFRFKELAKEHTQKTLLLESIESRLKHLKRKIKYAKLDVEKEHENIEDHGTAEEKQILKHMKDLDFVLNNWSNAIGWASKVKTRFTKARNEIIYDLVTSRVPGAIDGNSDRLDGSDIFEYFRAYLKKLYPNDSPIMTKTAIIDNIGLVSHLFTQNYYLFSEMNEKDWVSIHKDVRQSLYLINQAPTDIQDASCKFLLSQRFLAQLINLKGMKKAPQLEGDGTLSDLSEDPDHEVNNVTIRGIFNEVVDQAWIEKQMVNPDPNSKSPDTTKNSDGSVNPLEYFSFINTFAEILSYSNKEIWMLPDSSGGLIPYQMMPLSFGILGLSLQSITPAVIEVHGTQLSINGDNTSQSFSMLLNANIEVLNAIEEQLKFHATKPEFGFLPAKHLEMLSSDGDMKIMLTQLLYAGIKESISIIEKDPSDVRLIDALLRSGAHLENRHIYTKAYKAFNSNAN